MDGYQLHDLKWSCTYSSGSHLAEERFKGDFFKQKNDPKGSKFSKAKNGLIKKGLLRIEVNKRTRCEFWVLDISRYPQHKLTSLKEREEKEQRVLQQEKEKEQRRQARMADYDRYKQRCEALGRNTPRYEYWIKNRPDLESSLKEAEKDALEVTF